MSQYRLSMLGHLNAVCSFVAASQAAVGAADAPVAPLKESQKNHLLALFRTMKPTMEDAAATLQALATPMVAFSDTQRHELAAVVTQAAAGDAAMSPGSKSGWSPQSHMYMCNFMTRADWVALQASGSSAQEKISVVVERCLAIGLCCPNELSIVSMLSMIAVAGGLTWSADESYSMLQEIKSILKIKRNATRSEQTCKTFPMKCDELMKLHPGRYSDDSPAVPSPISFQLIEERRLTMAARRSHKTLSRSPTMPSWGAAPQQNQFMAFMAQAFMNQHQPQARRSAEPLPIVFT